MTELEQSSPAHSELDAAQPTSQQTMSALDDIQRQLDQARRDHEQALAELADFKARVREVAIHYGEEHSQCEVLDQALTELGLAPRSRDYSVRIQIAAVRIHSVRAQDEEQAIQGALAVVDIREGRTYQLCGWDVYVDDVHAEVD